MPSADYQLKAKRTIPNFAAEHRYVATEKEYASRQALALRAHWWLRFSYPPLGIYRPADWHRYIHALETYRRHLDEHEQEIRSGLVPFSFYLVHRADEPDSHVKIHVTISGGQIHPKMKPPIRPLRMDGAPDKSRKAHFHMPSPGGFSRKGIRIGRRSIDVEFSTIGSNDNAMAVNQVLYIQLESDAKMAFTLRSDRHPQELRAYITRQD